MLAPRMAMAGLVRKVPGTGFKNTRCEAAAK